jgi:tetratricopeptide (TPR) repeat protein
MKMIRLVAGLVFVLTVALFITACEPAQKTGGVSTETAVLSLTDQPVEQWRRDLLDLAFSGVSDMPLRPHIKNRSRAQQDIADACLELNQPALAFAYLEQIENWQRWMGFANLAYYLAENGDTEQSKKIAATVKAALQAADDLHSGRVVASTPNPLVDTLEDRRYQSVLSRMADLSILNPISNPDGIDAETYGEVNASSLNLNLLPVGTDHFEGNMAALRVVTEDPNFEIVHVGLLKMAELVDRQYEIADFRAVLDADVQPKLQEKIPVFIRIDVLRKFAGVAVRHGDMDVTDLLLQQIDGMVDKLKSSPRYYIPEAAGTARLRFDAGQPETARSQLEQMRTIYREKESMIVNIERAGLLCDLAETAQYLGETDRALDFYSQAVAAGQINPNSRPQAEDLGRICCSLALNDVKPTEDLLTALNAMKAGLGDPW